MTIYIADISGLDPSYARLPPRSARSGSAFALSLLEYALHREYALPLPEVAEDENGKPFFPARPDICFSLGHSVRHALAAVSPYPVGADVEDLGRRLSARFAEWTMDERERREFDPLELWVLRESLYKLRGGGDLRAARFRREDGRVVPPDELAACRLYRAEDFVCALSAERGSFPDTPVIVPATAITRPVPRR